MHDKFMITIAISNLVVLWLVYLKIGKIKVNNVYEYALELISHRLMEISEKLDIRRKEKKESYKREKIIANNNLAAGAEIIKDLKLIDKEIQEIKKLIGKSGK